MGAARDQGSTLVDETVTQEWQDPHLATVFSKWHDFIEPAQRESAEALIAEAGISEGDHVLDVACGSGTPALRIARVVGPNGSVTGLDPSPIFLAAIRENARKLGITNLTAVQGSAGRMAFGPETFDAVTCHMGVMFFPNITADLQNIKRVLKPGRRVAFVAWGPEEENVYFSAFWSVALPYIPPNLERMSEPDPGPDVPAPTRFSRPGTLGAELRKAGFIEVRERTVNLHFRWPGTAEQSLTFWFELTGIDQRIPPDRLDEFRNGIISSYNRFRDDDGLTFFPVPIVVASGQA